MYRVLAIIVLFASTCLAQDDVTPAKIDKKTPEIVFPVIKHVKPKPEPSNPTVDDVADKDTIPVLKVGEFCIIQCDAEFNVVVLPPENVTISFKKGPRDFTGKFMDGELPDEDRTYEKPFLCQIKVKNTVKGVSPAYIVMWVLGDQDKANTKIQLISVGGLPRPPPAPDPVEPDKPVPPVDDLTGFRAAIDALMLPAGATNTQIKGVAECFTKVAGQIDDGTISTTTAMTANTADEMKVPLGGLNGVEPWLDWRDAVLTTLANQKLKNFKDHGKYWKAVGQVLLTKVK